MTYIEKQTAIFEKRIEDSKDGSYHIATSREGYGWDGKLHSAMSYIASNLREKGYLVNSVTKYEVTDWRFFKK